MKMCKNNLHLYPKEQPFCKECRSIANKKWAENNKERRHNNYKKHYSKNKDQINKRTKEYYLSNKDSIKKQQKIYNKLKKSHLSKKSKEWSLKKRYNLTLDELNSIYEKQQHLCAICQKSELDLAKKLHVDHCHNTNVVRGLLCGSCNRALGLFKDSVEICLTAAQYLLNSKQSSL